MNVNNLQRIIMAIPGVFIVIVLFLSRQVELAMLLLVFDIIGTAGGIWWLSFSKKLAERVRDTASKKHGSLLTPSRLLRLFLIIIVAGCVLLGMVWMVRVATSNVVDLRCITEISRDAWIQFGECLKNNTICTNPFLACK